MKRTGFHGPVRDVEAYSQATPRPVKPLVRQHLRRATNKPRSFLMRNQLLLWGGHMSMKPRKVVRRFVR